MPQVRLQIPDSISAHVGDLPVVPVQDAADQGRDRGVLKMRELTREDIIALHRQKQPSTTKKHGERASQHTMNRESEFVPRVPMYERQ